MENNQEISTGTVAVTEKEKMSQKQMIGMIILTVIALAGVAFGVWGMMGKNEAEHNLAIKIKETDGTVTEIETDKITSVDENGTVTEITDTNVTTSVANPAEYIYIGEWGLKIKIGSEPKITKIEFNGGDGVYIRALSSAVLNDSNFNVYLFNGGQLLSGPGNNIARSKDSVLETTNGYRYDPIYNDGTYNYFVPAVSGYGIDPTFNAWADEIINSYNRLFEILNNPDNYSKI